MEISFLNEMTKAEAEIYASLVNESYRDEEAGIWKKNHQRTTPAEILEFVGKKEIVAIKEANHFIGGIRVKMIDDQTASWRMLWVDKNHRGKKVTSKLFQFIEKDLRKRHVRKILFEVLRTVKWSHPKKDQLIAWYRRIGYKKTSTANFLDFYPKNKDTLATDVEFYLMEKDLTEDETNDQDGILITGHLNLYMLNKLFIEEASTIIVKGFIEKYVCETTVSSIMALNDDERKMFTEQSYSKNFDQDANSQEREKYKNMAWPLLARLRSFSGSYLSPIDKLRLAFDEIWPSGANLGTCHGFKMYAGKIRTQNDESSERSLQKIFDQQFVAQISLETGDLLLTKVENTETINKLQGTSLETYFALNSEGKIQLWS